MIMSISGSWEDRVDKEKIAFILRLLSVMKKINCLVDTGNPGVKWN